MTGENGLREAVGTIKEEVRLLREKAHKHANMLQSHESTQVFLRDDLEGLREEVRANTAARGEARWRAGALWVAAGCTLVSTGVAVALALVH